MAMKTILKITVVFFTVFGVGMLCIGKDNLQTPIELNVKGTTYPHPDSYLFFEDSTGQYTIDEVSQPEFQDNFTKVNTQSVRNLDSYFWIKFSIKGTPDIPYVVVFNYVYRVMEFYLPTEKKGFTRLVGGINIPQKTKMVNSPNDVFYFIPQEKENVYYFRVKRLLDSGIYATFYPFSEYTNSQTANNITKGFLMGIVFIVAFYTLMLFIRLRMFFYLYFSFFVVSFGLYELVEMKQIFQYLWAFNITKRETILLYHVPTAFSIMSLMLFCREILNLKVLNEKLYALLTALVLVRALLLILAFFSPIFAVKLELDLVFTAVPLLIGTYYFFEKSSHSKYFTIAYILIFLSYLMKIFSLKWARSILWDIHIEDYFMWFNVIAISLFSLTLAQMMKMLQNEITLAQAERMQQLMEKENMKDKLNKELEAMVAQRTNEIHERNTQLDTLIYKTSHDIRGPLKSIAGIADIAMMENTTENVQTYFEHIKKSAVRLDNTIVDLLNIMKANHFQAMNAKVDFEAIIKEVMSSLEYMPGYNEVAFQYTVQKDINFESDQKVLYSVFQNLIENAINYRDTKKDKSFIHIKVAKDTKALKIEISDNGIGIPHEKQANIFDLFYQANSLGVGTGLGLHIIKISIQNLGGDIKLMSTEGIGTTFIITFKNLESI